MTKDFTPYRLGKLEAVRPAGLMDLPEYTATRSLPTPPSNFSDVATLQKIKWGMDLNDSLGDCTIAGTDHLLAWWDVLFGEADARPSTDVLRAQYQALSPDDQGCVESTVLHTWQTSGLFGGTSKIAAYAPFKRTATSLQQAIAFTGGAYLGIACPDSAQQQFAEQEQTGKIVPWTVVPGATIEGGHCIVAPGYVGLEGVWCITWGSVVLVTWDFIKRYCDEIWGIISHQLVEKGADTLGLQVAAIQGDLPKAA